LQEAGLEEHAGQPGDWRLHRVVVVVEERGVLVADSSSSSHDVDDGDE
jgi:hypothetical protein